MARSKVAPSPGEVLQAHIDGTPGLSPRQFALSAGLHPSMVYRFLEDDGNPTESTILKIATASGLPVEKLLRQPGKAA